MKRLLFLVPVLAGLMLGSSMVAQNKNVPTRIGYVDVEQVVQAHPKYPAVKEIADATQKELKPLQDKLQPLSAKIQAGTATAKEQQDAQLLRQTIQQTASKYQQKQAAALEPITKSLDDIIAKVAQQQNFALILDRRVARDSGLVIYADDSLNLTDAVIKAIPKN